MRDECVFSDCQNSASTKADINHGWEIKFDCLLTFSKENSISYSYFLLTALNLCFDSFHGQDMEKDLTL